MVADEIHLEHGHLYANELSILTRSSTGFSGQTIDLNSGVMISGASTLGAAPGPGNLVVPRETISINNERVTPHSVFLANVVSQCNSKSAVHVIEIIPTVGSVEFVLANFGSRACSDGNILNAETYTVNFLLLNPDYTRAWATAESAAAGR